MARTIQSVELPGGARLQYVEQGARAGVPLVLLHGYTDSWRSFELVLPYLRALAAFDTQVLGWDDLPFHFIVDRDGTIYEGRAGGPTAAVPRLSGGDAAVHVALIGSSSPPAPSWGRRSSD